MVACWWKVYLMVALGRPLITEAFASGRYTAHSCVWPQPVVPLPAFHTSLKAQSPFWKDPI